MEVVPDHVHLLVGCDPQYGIHRLVKGIKRRFLAAKAKAARRQCGAKTAGETKRAALMQQVLEMQVSVETRPEHWVRRATIEAYNERHWDGDGTAEDAPPEFLERITVNLIRHNLTACDRALEEVAGRVGIASAVQSKDLLELSGFSR